MSVTVYPYLAEPAALNPQAGGTAQETKRPDFSAALSAADRNLQLRAVDALIRRSETGSVDVQTVQRILGFQPTVPRAVNTGLKIKGTASGNSGTGAAQAGDAVTGASVPQAGDAVTGADASADLASSGCTPQLDAYFAEAAALYNVDASLLKAIAQAESGFNPNATSDAGAKGIMQLMPDTVAGLGIPDAYDARDNILGGAKVIAEYIQRYNGDISLALAAYNAGPGSVDRYNGVPPYDETKNYVSRVMNYYRSAV